MEKQLTEWLKNSSKSCHLIFPLKKGDSTYAQENNDVFVVIFI